LHKAELSAMGSQRSVKREEFPRQSPDLDVSSHVSSGRSKPSSRKSLIREVPFRSHQSSNASSSLSSKHDDIAHMITEMSAIGLQRPEERDEYSRVSRSSSRLRRTPETIPLRPKRLEKGVTRHSSASIRYKYMHGVEAEKVDNGFEKFAKPDDIHQPSFDVSIHAIKGDRAQRDASVANI
jgi:hypothetical protein